MPKAPYFPFYPKDFSADSVVEAMSTEAVGAYVLLLCKAWHEDPPGSLPDDDAVLSRWARMDQDSWLGIRHRVLAAFQTGVDGRLHQKRMQAEFAKLSYRFDQLSDAGSKGGRKKWVSESAISGKQKRSERMAEARRKGRHTDQEWAKMVELCGVMCLRCKRRDVKLVKDHITPIYQGGSDDIRNIQPLCTSCNCSKGPDGTDLRPSHVLDWLASIPEKMPSEARRTSTDSRLASGSGSGSAFGFSQGLGVQGEGVFPKQTLAYPDLKNPSRLVVEHYQRTVGNYHSPAGGEDAVVGLMVDEGLSPEKLKSCADHYAAKCAALDTSARFRFCAKRFYGEGGFREFLAGPVTVKESVNGHGKGVGRISRVEPTEEFRAALRDKAARDAAAARERANGESATGRTPFDR